MICIVLKSPDGTKSIGLSTDGTTTRDGVTCLPGFLGSVSPLAHRANISRASGCLPEPIEWGFDMIDWTGLVRRSVGILDGSAQLVGWSADIYSDADVILGTGAFEVVGAVASDGLIQVSCRERWIGNQQTVGSGSGSDFVGLAVGGAQVSVKTQDLTDPIAIEYRENTGWYNVSPNSPQLFSGPRTHATGKGHDHNSNAYAFNFSCFPGTGNDFYLRITAGDARITGSKYSQSVTVAWVLSDVVGVQVSQEFYDNEEPGNVSIFSVDSGMRAIIGGADSLTGFISDSGAIVNPLGDTSISAGGVIHFSPRLTAPDGFIAHTLIPCSIAFAPGWTPQSLGGSNEISYYGSTSAINTDGAAVPDWEPLDSSLIPTSPQSQFSARIKWFLGADLILPLRLQRLDDGTKYDRYEIDARTKWTAKALQNAAYTIYADKQEPYSKEGVVFDSIVAPAGMGLSSGVRELQGPGTYDPNTSFATFDEINSSPAHFCGLILRSTIANANDLVCTWQFSALRLYGVSTLKYGSSYAVIQPGASPWWSSPRTPTQAAVALLSATGAAFTARAPSYPVPTSSWGRAFDASTTLSTAAAEIAKEHWIFLGRGVENADAGAQGEVMGQPSFTLGDRGDVVTEIVIEYDEWAGGYRKKAYTAHVDEAYNPANPSRYFGGWDDDGAETGYGLAIWNACRKAYLIHGIKASDTIQAPSIRSSGTLGRIWTAVQNGLSRAQWLSLQTRYVKLSVVETAPTWWAGNSVKIPLATLDWAGYNLSSMSNQYLVCVEKSWDPMTRVTTFEVALPPVPDISTQRRIMQTLDSTNRITQRLDATERIIQVQG